MIAPTDAPKTRSAVMPRRDELLEHADLDGAPAAAAGEDEGGALRWGVATVTSVTSVTSVASVLGEVGALGPSGAHAVGERELGRAFEVVGVAHDAAPGESGGCCPRARASCRARQAFLPARSWRTAHMITMTANVIIATTKSPKITKNAVLPADASRTSGWAGAMSISG